jgi:hypothetical protein
MNGMKKSQVMEAMHLTLYGPLLPGESKPEMDFLATTLQNQWGSVQAELGSHIRNCLPPAIPNFQGQS